MKLFLLFFVFLLLSSPVFADENVRIIRANDKQVQEKNIHEGFRPLDENEKRRSASKAQDNTKGAERENDRRLYNCPTVIQVPVSQVPQTSAIPSLGYGYQTVPQSPPYGYGTQAMPGYGYSAYPYGGGYGGYFPRSGYNPWINAMPGQSYMPYYWR